ncbi:hypothetical protein QZH41_011094 [Actinostola sp. cb2023]|nr:hypothetical protein QZH41_011094 [Actinostola sp. cb2023]
MYVSMVTCSILGHEGVIEVVHHKRPTSKLQPGDRLTFHIVDCCYNCENCNDDLHQKCVALFKYGWSVLSNGTGANGCFATHVVIRKGTHVARVPSEISNKVAAPINCALATMVYATAGVIEMLSLDKECKRVKTALIQGAGLLGVYGCALLHEAGYKVYCSDVNPERLEMVSKFGAIPVLPGESSGPTENSVDVVVEVCGHRSVISEGLRLIRNGGTYVWIGLVHPDSKLDMITAQQIIQKCLTIQGFHNYGPSHLDKAVVFLARTVHKYPYDELFSPPYALKDIDDAVAMAIKQTYHRVCFEP